MFATLHHVANAGNVANNVANGVNSGANRRKWRERGANRKITQKYMLIEKYH